MFWPRCNISWAKEILVHMNYCPYTSQSLNYSLLWTTVYKWHPTNFPNLHFYEAIIEYFWLLWLLIEYFLRAYYRCYIMHSNLDYLVYKGMCVADDAVSFDMKVDALFSWMRRIQNIQIFFYFVLKTLFTKHLRKIFYISYFCK